MLGLNYTFKNGLAEYYTVCKNKCILKWFKFFADNLDIYFTWTHCTLMITFKCTFADKLSATHTSCKLAYTLLPAIINQVHVSYISSIFLYFHWDFDKRHYFYDKGIFISFFKLSPFARLYLEVLVTIPRLNLKTECIDGLLCYISFCFNYSSVFFS